MNKLIKHYISFVAAGPSLGFARDLTDDPEPVEGRTDTVLWPSGSRPLQLEIYRQFIKLKKMLRNKSKS